LDSTGLNTPQIGGTLRSMLWFATCQCRLP
jgi:hypothetical protein